MKKSYFLIFEINFFLENDLLVEYITDKMITLHKNLSLKKRIKKRTTEQKIHDFRIPKMRWPLNGQFVRNVGLLGNNV